MNTSAGSREGNASSVGAILEHAAVWGLPASPLFMAILMMLAHAPYASPIAEPTMFYLACMAGAFVAFVACAVLPIWRRPLPLSLCWLAGILLEVGWLVLLAGEKIVSAPVLLAGSFLTGLSTACLLVLWLCVGQTDSVKCEVAKLAASFTVAFMVYSLFSLIPHAGTISYLFPVATCIPLAVRLRKDDLGGEGAPLAPRSLFTTGSQLAAASIFLVGVGAGFAVLGFGGAQVELGVGLTALVLVAAFIAPSIKDRISPTLGRIATPLMVIALCLAVLLNDTGNPFAFYLTGCAALVAWLFLRFRYDGAELAIRPPRAMAAFLGWVTLCAGVGIGVERIALGLMGEWGVRGSMAPVVLVIFIATADFLLKTALAAPVPVKPRQQAEALSVPIDTTRLAESFALSPREAQVAALLCQNRSVSYICATLGLATSTAKTHIRHVYEKTDVHSRSELQILAERLDQASSAPANTARTTA